MENIKNPFSLWQRVEDNLAMDEDDSYWLTAIPSFLLDVTDLSYCFITEFFESDSQHFYIRGGFPELSGIKESYGVDTGLAGWVHHNKKSLALNSLNTNENLTFIFSQKEPIKRPTSFYGWPLIYHDKLMGGLFLVGTKDHILDPIFQPFFQPFTLRLSAHINHMRLFYRVNELKGLDPQTGLPHRTNFLDRLEHLLSFMSSQQQPLRLRVLSISGLGRYSLTHSLEDTQKLLRSIATQLLHFATESWELGHISYGLFAIALPESELPRLDKTTYVLKKILNEWSSFGQTHSNFIFHEKEVRFPENGSKAEELLENALTLLAKA
jgi:GGDEF domain-containing protein